MSVNNSHIDLPNLNSTNLFGTDSLCFDKTDFMLKDFNVDAFVQVHQASGKGGLDLLRDDLGIYLKILRSAMIDLINRDYADFVNLSTNLTGLDQLINALKTPLGQMREEVLAVEQLLAEAMDDINFDVKRRHTINRYKSLLHCIDQISIRLTRLEALLKSKDDSMVSSPALSSNEKESDLVYRLASEVNHLNFLVSHCDGAALVEVFKPRVNAVCKFVENGLEEGLKKGILTGDKQLLSKTLRTYASLGTVSHAHEQVRIVVRSHLEEVISESALKSDPRGLKGLYDNILSTVKNVCAPILAVSMGTGSEIIAGYSFIECSVWPEIQALLELRTPSIFSSGNPSVFHQRYLQTEIFLADFEALLSSQVRVNKFRGSLELQKFFEMWNLPVYFQMRYQEIGLVLESSLSDSSEGLSLAPRTGGFRFGSSRVVWESLRKCFDSEIFLRPLLHRFWKLSLLILSRHRTFIAHSANKLKKALAHSSKEGSGTAKFSNKDNTETSSSVDSINLPSPEAQTLLLLLADVDAIASSLSKMYSTVILPTVGELPKEIVKVIEDTIETQRVKYLSLQQDLYAILQDFLSQAISSALKQVADTPRIYRRTNKPVPSTHQAYVNRSLRPLSIFVNFVADEGLSEKIDLTLVFADAFDAACKDYYALIFDVLNSVQKMEESLRRLKMARERGSQTLLSHPPKATTDDDKIRMQIHKDVLHFGSQMCEFGVDIDHVDSYTKLLKMVDDAVEGKLNS